jgi:hypothetical protein
VSASSNQVLENLRAAVSQRGLVSVARELRVYRHTLSSVLAGSARAGSVALVVERFRELHREVKP